MIAIGVSLPDSPELDILAELKADDDIRNIPVVILATGAEQTQSLIRLRASTLGAHTVYSGPPDGGGLAGMLQSVLEV